LIGFFFVYKIIIKNKLLLFGFFLIFLLLM